MDSGQRCSSSSTSTRHRQRASPAKDSHCTAASVRKWSTNGSRAKRWLLWLALALQTLSRGPATDRRHAAAYRDTYASRPPTLRLMQDADAIVMGAADLIAQHGIDADTGRCVVLQGMPGEQVLPLNRPATRFDLVVPS